MKKRFKNMPPSKEREVLDLCAGWHKEGKTQHEMADELNTLGHTTAIGLRWTHHTVSYFLRKRGRAVTNRLRRETGGRTVVRTHIARATIEAILTEPALDDKQRVVVLSALMGA